MRKKGFTLVEILIVVVISGIFITALFKAYSTISETSAKVENIKTVSSQLGFLQNYMQSFVNGTKMNYEIYTGENKINLQKGRTNTIFLTGKQRIKIYKTGSCFDFTGNKKKFAKTILNKKCWLEVVFYGNEENSNKISKLTDPNQVYISNFSFQIFPQSYYSGDILKSFDSNRKSQGFWIFGQIWIKNRNENRVSNVKNNFQYFFGL